MPAKLEAKRRRDGWGYSRLRRPGAPSNNFNAERWNFHLRKFELLLGSCSCRTLGDSSSVSGGDDGGDA